jgi:sugar lactone lactonase YvrE
MPTQPRVLSGLGTALLGLMLVFCAPAGEDNESEPTGATEQAFGKGKGKDLNLSFATLVQLPLVIEGLTADDRGNLYAAARGGTPTCPVYRVPASGGAVEIVGHIPANPTCSANGLAFDRRGTLYVTSGAAIIYKLVPNAANPPTGEVFTSGTPGANGIAFDEDGNLWATDGGTAQGRVYKVTPDGTASEVFRIPPTANLVNAVDQGGGTVKGGVGRDNRALPPGSITATASTRAAADTTGSVPIVSNGIVFDENGKTLYLSDTARGAIWRVDIDKHGNADAETGCDTTYSPNTLCLSHVFVQHPALEGADGIVLDHGGNLWATANERNAIVVVTKDRQVIEAFRNTPDATTQLRNNGPLEFPTTPFIVDKKLCVAQSDVARRDNFPNTGGEVANKGKISCTTNNLPYKGVPIPIR